MDIPLWLRKRGPSLTSDLISAMVEGGVSAVAARQRVNRAPGEVKRLAGLRFAKNARFIYLDEQYATDEFWRALERAFQTHGLAYWTALTNLKARGGLCPTKMFERVASAPLNRRGQLSPERIYDRLHAVRLLHRVRTEERQSFVEFWPDFYHKASLAHVRATLLAEQIVLLGVRDWARKLGLGSHNAFKLRGANPQVSSLVWDLSAPSYARPLAQRSDGSIKPGFVVCDVNFTGIINEDEISAFIRKHDLAAAPTRVAPILPMFVGEIFSEAAFARARAAGITAVTVGDLLGKDIAKGLRDLIDLLSDQGATASANPDHLHHVMEQLTAIEGASHNVRAALFELVIGALIKDVEGGYLQTGVSQKRGRDRPALELDVLLTTDAPKPVYVIECKAKLAGAQVSLQDVERWYENRVPTIAEFLGADRRFIGRKFRLELWTNGNFHPAAAEYLARQQTEFGRYSVAWKEGTVLRAYARAAPTATIRKTLNEHYFTHSLKPRARNEKKAG
ncbi:MAG: hypothetical protein WDN76_08160 [Alphaproteobacteria bacterium]